MNKVKLLHAQGLVVRSTNRQWWRSLVPMKKAAVEIAAAGCKVMVLLASDLGPYHKLHYALTEREFLEYNPGFIYRRR